MKKERETRMQEKEKEVTSSVTFPFSVTVKTGKRKNEFIVDKTGYTTHINAQPKDNEANKELVKFLSRHLKKRIKILSGFKSRKKLIGLV
jgi:uncharacterized protein YggU (UPF0235/DUF167 family)